mgnify:FL=1
MRRLQALFLAAVLSLVAVPLCAGSDVDSLRINVELRDDGAALVTETWRINVSDDISEWYLVADNMGRMTIEDLRVCDETGNEYVNEGEWNVNRSRARKVGRCGLVTKSDGYEICWGVGSSGWHTYTVRYLLTGLVKGHEDLDGFNHMFVARDLGSSPQSIVLTIRKPGLEFTTENTKVWAFGFHGEIHVEDGVVVARTTEPFTRRSALIAMVGFEKGLFHPALAESRTFDEVRQTAMEGSDYREPDKDGDFWIGLLVGLGVVLSVFVSVKVIVKTVKRKRELLGGGMRNVAWFRDAPLGGDLKKSSNILLAFSGNTMLERQNLIAAYITRLFYRGAFEIVPQPGKSKPLMRIRELEVDDSTDSRSDAGLESRLYSFIKEAAGEDGILQKNELQRWANRHGEALYDWGLDAWNGVTIWTMKPEDARQVFGLRRYLKDFTMIKDRGVVEVKLWNNYLIFASLYGIADQLMKDFRKVCPEYFTLSSAARLLDDDVTTFMIWNMINMTSRDFNTAASTYEASRSNDSGSGWSGGGGMASWGGGGGFSGGGSGGGGR